MFDIFHPVACPDCGHNLRQSNAIRVEFSDGERTINEALSQTTEDGALIDPTGQVAIGQHAGSYCDACDVLLDELEEEEDQ